jgi:hypothetical protein
MSTPEDVPIEMKSTKPVDETTTTTPVVDTPVPEDLRSWIVYLLIMIVGDAVVYVGSTYRDEVERGQEHLNICGGSPRVAITFSQKQFQPRDQSFRIEVAWSGVCTRQQARGIEQYFIEKHKTRVYPRPTNGVTRDIDLISGAPPLQLNVMNATTDRAMVEYAETRVKRDSAIISTDVFEQLRVRQRLEVVALELDVEAQRTSLSVLERITAKYDAMPVTQAVSIAQFQSDLNDVLKSNSDDNRELRNCLSGLLLYYNADHRGADFTLCAGMATGHFETMWRIVRPTAAPSKRRTEELSLEASKRPRPSASILESIDEYHTGTVRSNVGASADSITESPFIQAIRTTMDKNYEFTNNNKEIVPMKEFVACVLGEFMGKPCAESCASKVMYDRLVSEGLFASVTAPVYHESLRIGPEGQKVRCLLSGLRYKENPLDGSKQPQSSTSVQPGGLKAFEQCQVVYDELADAWNRYARPCPTGVPADARKPHMCGCKGKDGKSLWCVVGTGAFYNDYSNTRAAHGRLPLMHRLQHDRSIDVATFAGQLDTALKKEAGSTKYSVEQVKRSTGKEAPRSRGCIFGWRHHTEAMHESDSTTSQHME